MNFYCCTFVDIYCSPLCICALGLVSQFSKLIDVYVHQATFSLPK